MKTTVIYHSADFDGIFCREIARKFLPDAELIGWNFGNAQISEPPNPYYILDLPPECVKPVSSLGHNLAKLIWIDHHKSSIDKYATDISGYRIDGVAACRLAWQWFAHNIDPNRQTKQDFVDRKVSEPLAVRLAGEYDIWDKRDARAQLFQYGLRSCDLTDRWELLLTPEDPSEFQTHLLLAKGETLQYASTQRDASIIQELGFTFQWEGLTFLACNAALYNSHLFTAGLRPEHDACYGFNWTGTQWSVSLYHAPGKEHHDLSAIAVKYGGGGHRGACGFRTHNLPFVNPGPNGR